MTNNLPSVKLMVIKWSPMVIYWQIPTTLIRNILLSSCITVQYVTLQIISAWRDWRYCVTCTMWFLNPLRTKHNIRYRTQCYGIRAMDWSSECIKSIPAESENCIVSKEYRPTMTWAEQQWHWLPNRSLGYVKNLCKNIRKINASRNRTIPVKRSILNAHHVGRTCMLGKITLSYIRANDINFPGLPIINSS